MQFTDEQNLAGTKALVLAQGHVRNAQNALKAAGIEVSTRALSDWRNTQRYEELSENRDWITQEHGELAGQSAMMAAMVEQAISRSLIEEPANPGPRATALKNVTDAKVKNVHLEMTIQGRPTRISETRSPLEAMRKLASGEFAHLFPGLKDSPLLESSAEEIPDP